MSSNETVALTERQQRELEYHREHAKKHQDMLSAPFSWEILDRPSRRWWNAYWQMYAYLCACDLQGKQVLVVGCGFGEDALRIAKLGATVSAFDLSPDALAIAKGLAEREGLEITFEQMPSESLSYPDNQFDYIIARDILHHVDIPPTMCELARVAKPGAIFVVDEMYSHSITEVVRRSKFVENFLYPKMRRLIYGDDKPYITEDERKLNETDVAQVMAPLLRPEMDKYFNFIVTRLIPDRFEFMARLDRVLLMLLKPVAAYLAGRVLFTARVAKSG